MSMSDKALIANLSISQCAFRKIDKRATGTVETTHATDHRVGNYTKKLLPGAKQLELIQSIATAIRKFFDRQTLPWLTDGSRILSSKNYIEFRREFRAHQNKFESAVNDFFIEYPQLRREARAKLGDLFNDCEYPSEAKLRKAFKCEVSCFPLPDVSDFRTEILDTEKDAFLESMRAIEVKAMQECWTRLYSVVANAAEKLKNPDTIFRDSLIGNIQDICELLPRLNVTDDPILEGMRREVEALAASVVPDTMRPTSADYKPEIRTDAAAALAAMADKMCAFMGAE